ncbi:MAG: FAD-dependent oxidoreductase [Sedimentisphaerales bacterium]|nr:FAD-dependent oxidoreductase [Sedimentisphaerales bacterium]
MRSCGIVICWLFVFFSAARDLEAAVVKADFDDLAPGVLRYQFGGIGFAAGDDWGDTGTIDVISGNLTAPAGTNYAAVGHTIGGTAQKVQGDYSDPRYSTRGFAEAFTGTVWFSCLARIGGDSGRAGVALDADAYSINNGRVLIRGDGGGGVELYTDGAADLPVAGVGYDQTVLILGRLQIDADGDHDILSVWVNPDCTSLGEPDVLIDDQDFCGPSLDRIGIGAYGSSQGRVDAVFLSTAYGDVTGVSAIAGNIAPAQQAENVSPHPLLQWSPPLDYSPSGYDVYFGSDPDVASNPKVLEKADLTEFETPYLDYQTVYYWRVDSYEPANPQDIRHEGAVWRFATCPAQADQATLPQTFTHPDCPADGDVNVVLRPPLEWSAPVNYGPTGYDVYFGTDPQVRNNPRVLDHAAQTVYTPAEDLAAAGRYYWAVDCYEPYGEPERLHEGATWSFETFTPIAEADPNTTVLVEAEAFADYGDWVLDQQFMDQMGSPFLLAHGINAPVADAATTVTFPAAGTYRIWLRTRDWVAPWKQPDTPVTQLAVGTPGIFQLLIDGVALPVVFGDQNAEWHWQDGGTVSITQTQVTIGLHDLTGYEGRCDAIVFTRDADLQPPEHDHPQMRHWRRRLRGIPEAPTEAGPYDLVVVGGGMAGMCAAVSAARLGVKVALVQDRPVLGGNNSSEVRVPLKGGIGFAPFPNMGSIVRELGSEATLAHSPAALYNDQSRQATVQAEPNIDLYLDHRANEVETSGDSIVAVVAEDIRTGRRVRFTGRWFSDCTGDGCIGYLAGADWQMTRPGHMGRTNYWWIVDTGSPTTFPACPFGLNLHAGGSFNESETHLGGWIWESGFDHDPIAKGEYIRDWNFRAMYGAWDALKNTRNKYPTHRLNWHAYISGKRESRRLLGDVILTRHDLDHSVVYPDGCVPATWTVDVHFPDPLYLAGFEGEAFNAWTTWEAYPRPYWIPYRCLYSRNIDNLFMAGRNISVTHNALGTVRVQRTTGMMGEVVGMAASLCKRYDTTPRGVYRHYLNELKVLMDGRGRWIYHLGPNRARQAQVTVETTYAGSPTYINDGWIDMTDNASRWVSGSEDPEDTITFRWPAKLNLRACRIVSGYYGDLESDGVISQVEGFLLQYRNDQDQWITVRQVADNQKPDWAGFFEPIRTDQFRVVVTQTPGDHSRIWEIEFYHPPADIDQDGQVGIGDVAHLTAAWLTDGSGYGFDADLDDNEQVNLFDFDILAEYWQW